MMTKVACWLVWACLAIIAIVLPRPLAHAPPPEAVAYLQQVPFDDDDTPGEDSGTTESDDKDEDTFDVRSTFGLAPMPIVRIDRDCETVLRTPPLSEPSTPPPRGRARFRTS